MERWKRNISCPSGYPYDSFEVHDRSEQSEYHEKGLPFLDPGWRFHAIFKARSEGDVKRNESDYDGQVKLEVFEPFEVNSRKWQVAAAMIVLAWIKDHIVNKEAKGRDR